jgi:very-short-patch-repair endonuclease
VLTKRQLRGPAWRRLFRDVYIAAGAPVDHLTRCQAAALLLPPGAALSHESAALAHNVHLFPLGSQAAHITVPLSSRLRPSGGLVVHRQLLTREEITRRGGLPVTNPRRTTFDLGRDPDPVKAVVALDALLNRRVVKEHVLAEIAAAHLGWPGINHFRAAAARCRPGVESPMETRLRLLLVDGGLPEPAVQHVVLDPAGHFVARLDLAYRARRVGLEYDGDHHRDRATFQRDIVRLNRLRLLGWTVLRFTADDVLRRPDRVVSQVRTALKITTTGNPGT